MMIASRALQPLSASRLLSQTLRRSPQFRAVTTSSLPHGSSPTPPPPRRAVTVANDTGRVPWGQLSAREKAARSTQQSVNFVVVIVGIVMTVGVSYVLYTEVFSTESKTAVFNRCADRIRKDQRCVELLAGRGKGGEIQAYGQDSWSRWARNRLIASKTETDKIGTEHMHMHFNVSGPLGTGVVNVHMTRGRSDSHFEYHSLALDVAGHERVWLENAEQGKLDKRNQGKMFGVRWW